MSDYGNRPTGGQNNRGQGSRPANYGASRPTQGGVRPAGGAARPANHGASRPTQGSARPAGGTARPANYGASRPAQGGSRPAGSAQPVRRSSSGGYAARYGRDRRKNMRNERQRYTEPPKGWFDALPTWVKLAIIAVLLVILIFAAVKLIASLGDRGDRTVIAPITSESAAPAETTAEPVPEETARYLGDPVSESDGGLETETPVEATQEPEWSPNETDTQYTYSGGLADRRRATIRMAGDIVLDTEMLEACYDKASDSYTFTQYFDLIGDTLSSSDYTMINLDASLRKGKYGYSGYPQFSSPPVILDVVKNVGADMMTMCNNHMLDGYCDGLVEGVGHVEAAGLDHIGGYTDEADSNEPEIYDINGIRVGFVTYTHSTNTMEDYCDDRTKFLVNYFKNANFEEDVRRTREAGAEVVVAVTHWGDEYKRSPDKDQTYWANKLVAAGVDLIIGGHPHVVQPAEYITATGSDGVSHTALCVYSIGNFLTQHRVQYTDSGIVFEFTLEENDNGGFSVVNPGYVPVYVWQFKNAAGNDDYRVMPIGVYMDNPPADMSADQYQRMKECWYETQDVLNGDSVMRSLIK